MKIDFGKKPYRRRDGHVGVRVDVRCEGTHPKTYSFDTHGMNSTEVAEKALALSGYHDAKMAKMAEFVEHIHDALIVVDGVTYRVVDCTIFDAGVELYLDVRRLDGESMIQVDGFPITKKLRDIALVPSHAEIMQMIALALPAPESGVQSAHEEFVQKVRDKMKAKV